MYHILTLQSTTYEGLPALIVIALLIAYLTLPFLLVMIIAAIVRRIHEHRLKRYADTIITQYDPPHDLRPAEVGYLYDMKCDDKEIRATLFDLDIRGVISIVDKNTVLIIDQAMFDQLKEFEKIAVKIYSGKAGIYIQPSEKKLSDYISPQGQVIQIQVPSVENNTRLGFSMAVRASLKDRGYPIKSYVLSILLRSFIPALFASLWLFGIVGLINIQNGSVTVSVEILPAVLMATFFFLLVFYPVYYGIGLCFTLLWSKIAGRYWLYSKKTRSVWRELEGYKLFLKKVDLTRIQFESATAHVIDPTIKTLPYAIVFGLDTDWQKRLPARPLR